ncbi:ArsC family reductase [Segetibacter sp.]|jgi:arsenate reductase|uniref:ArsC family reductase n=1 Tax=Segetibacter sp. TaxID=2231182 RepID=UPI00262E144C|nr:ArsC family reductase [Segetibacter sp.]MCW3081360.1 arsenate reductase and related [Segetibacter sp.]
MKVYGIRNCNTVKKAIEWLKDNGTASEFHDFKKQGIAKEKLLEWAKEVGWERLMNKKGTTWRSLSAEQQQNVKNEGTAVALMLEKPSIIKRPVIETGGKLIVGFVEEEYKTNFKKQ